MSMYCIIKQGQTQIPTNNGSKNREQTAAKATGWHKHSIGTKYLAWIQLLFQHGNSLAHKEDLLFFVSCVSHAFTSLHCCLVVTCWERADLLTLVVDVNCIFFTFPCGILCQLWYLII